MNYADEQLKRALAKMLSSKLVYCTKEQAGFDGLHLLTDEKEPGDEIKSAVLDNQLLSVCREIGETLTDTQKQRYLNLSYGWRQANADWQLRTIWLAKVKEVEI